MNTHNLIKLGAFAQCNFNLLEDFKIMEIPSDSGNSYRVVIFHPHKINAANDYDDVELIKMGSTDNYEFIWCGYSRRANVLLIKNTRDVQQGQK